MAAEDRGRLLGDDGLVCSPLLNKINNSQNDNDCDVIRIGEGEGREGRKTSFRRQPSGLELRTQLPVVADNSCPNRLSGSGVQADSRNISLCKNGISSVIFRYLEAVDWSANALADFCRLDDSSIAPTLRHFNGTLD